MAEYSVILPLSINKSLTYKSDTELEPGDFVLVEIKNKESIGIIIDRENDQDRDFEIKAIKTKLFLPKISKENLCILDEIAYFHLEQKGIIFSIILNIVETFWKQTISLDKILKILNKNEEIEKKQVSIKQLEDFLSYRKILDQFSYIKDSYQSPITLNDEQKKAYMILNSENNSSTILLEGETGSGKTIVYLEKIKDILIKDKNAQILILLPEIALTNAILYRVEQYLGIKPFAWHSNMSTKERKENFLAVTFGIARVVVGARSGIFLPFNNLKLIVIDEEHDDSFKQDQQILYHTTDIAQIISKHNKNLQIILSSATPSLDTIYNVKMKKYKRIVLESKKTLEERMNLSFEDMTKEENKGNLISNTIIEKIKIYLERGFQSMIFLNKRGYNSIVICKKCNNKLTCKNCSTGLIFHKELNKFFCSYCSFSIYAMKAKCNTCFSENEFKFYGYGVEKIYELIAENFPELANNNRIALLSSDNNKDLQEKIKQIENGELDIIVGTQILAKGHNFPKLAFLGVIDGGLNFSGVDLRSSEKTYQILHQIIGRLGRFNIKGEAIIQTLEAQSIILKALLEQNRTKFYTYEFQQRQNFNMPPFSKLFKLTFSNYDQDKALKLALKFTNTIDYHSEVELIGPSPSAIIKINKMYRYNLLMKSEKEFDLTSFLHEQIAKHQIHHSSLRIDVSPMNFI